MAQDDDRNVSESKHAENIAHQNERRVFHNIDRPMCQKGRRGKNQSDNKNASLLADGICPRYQDERDEDVHENIDANKIFQKRAEDKHQYQGDEQGQESIDAYPGEWNAYLFSHIRLCRTLMLPDIPLKKNQLYSVRVFLNTVTYYNWFIDSMEKFKVFKVI